MPLNLKPRARWLFAAVILAALLGAGTALAFGPTKLHITAPGTVVLGSNYHVKVTGKTGGRTDYLYTFEGGYTGGAAINCYSTYALEDYYYPGLLLTTYVETGHFKKTWTFLAAHLGHKAFCAYLVSGGITYKHASAHWDNVS